MRIHIYGLCPHDQFALTPKLLQARHPVTSPLQRLAMATLSKTQGYAAVGTRVSDDASSTLLLHQAWITLILWRRSAGVWR